MDTASELSLQGKRFFENRQYKMAEQYLRHALDKGAAYADVFNMLGVIEHTEGKFASSIEHFRRALRINPNYTEAVLNLAVLYNDLGQYAAARKLYDRLKRRRADVKRSVEPVLGGKLSNMHADVGDIYRTVGLFKLAIDEYKKALAINPGYHDIRTKLGAALCEDHEYGASIRELKKVLKAKPAYVPAQIQLGIAHFATGKPVAALTAWKKVLKLDPRNKIAQMYAGMCKKPK